MKYYIAGKQYYEENWLITLGGKRVETIEECDFVLFNGGTDVNPTLYKQRRGKYTESPDIARDNLEIEEYNKAQKLNKKCVGVCRGAQLLCVLGGGSLIQHVFGHNSNHEYRDIKGNHVAIGSWHHQMMFPFKIVGLKIVGVAKISSYNHFGEDNRNIIYPKNFFEVETCILSKTRSLCIQTHPEWLDVTGKELFQSYLKEFLETGTIAGRTDKISQFSIERTTISSKRPKFNTIEAALTSAIEDLGASLNSNPF